MNEKKKEEKCRLFCGNMFIDYVLLGFLLFTSKYFYTK